jgi:hypothetical protein
MSNNVDLKELEKKAYTSTFEDGLLDIFFGTMLALNGISPLLEHFGISRHWVTGTFLSLAIFYWAGKKFITMPRIGLVKFGKERKKKTAKAITVIFSAVVLTWTVWILIITNSIGFDSTTVLKGYGSPVAEGLVFLTVFSLLAYFLYYKRMYLIALLFFISIPLAKLLHEPAGTPYNSVLAYCGPGFVVIILGLFSLSRFLKKYPKPVLEISNDTTA